MYSPSEIVRGLRNPRKIGRELNRLYHRRCYSRPYNTDGVSIFARDWDNLIVLDACRYDAFENTVELPGSLQSIKSMGSTTFEWVRANFRSSERPDTVYVSANLWFARLKKQINADVHDFLVPDGVERESENDAVVDAYRRGTHPELLNQQAMEASRMYPNKRLIIHYMQPHSPYIGPVGDDYFEPEGHLTEQLAAGKLDVSRGSVVKAYEDNLRVVLKYADELISELNGKSVVTADHGEMLGDRYQPLPFSDYGHNPGIYSDQLVKVPWFIVDHNSRREVVADISERYSYEENQAEIKDHLEDLGYVL